MFLSTELISAQSAEHITKIFMSEVDEIQKRLQKVSHQISSSFRTPMFVSTELISAQSEQI